MPPIDRAALWRQVLEPKGTHLLTHGALDVEVQHQWDGKLSLLFKFQDHLLTRLDGLPPDASSAKLKKLAIAQCKVLRLQAELILGR